MCAVSSIRGTVPRRMMTTIKSEQIGSARKRYGLDDQWMMHAFPTTCPRHTHTHTHTHRQTH
eukprot:514969-Rhodomonas_salina.1